MSIDILLERNGVDKRVRINNIPNNIRTIAVRNTYHFRIDEFNRYIRLLYGVMLTFYTRYSYVSVWTIYTHVRIDMYLRNSL